jgi:CubicO group peptidase (beta-lactamase class C family)
MDQLLTWALDERPLTSQPGTKYEYSNLGYQILGKVIEKKSGMSYEQFMRANVLVPSGVTNMQIGGSTSAERKPGEARYYSEGGSVYSHTPGIIQRLGSAGGWIASPIDLLRVMTHIDGFSSVPDILNPPTIQLLTTRSVLSGYACGLHVNTNGNWWHSGSLTGTRAWIVRSASGYCWAILMNKSCSHSEFDTALDNLIWTAIRTPDAVWPETDLF